MAEQIKLDSRIKRAGDLATESIKEFIQRYERAKTELIKLMK